MKRLMKVVFALVAVMALSAPAFAKDDPRFEIGHKAVAAAGVPITESAMGKDFRGKDALMLTSTMAAKDIMDKFLEAYRVGTSLEGAQVIGLAFQPHSKTWKVTMMKDGEISSIKIIPTDKGATIEVRCKRAMPKNEEGTGTGTVK